MTSEPFSDAERDRLRNILAYEEEFVEHMRLVGARRLLFRTYRSLIIGMAGLIAAVLTLGEQVKQGLKHLLTGFLQ